MTITMEKSLQHFDFWGGAAANAAKLTPSELDTVEAILEDIAAEPLSMTAVNDWFWFDFETICEWLGLEEEEVLARK